METVNPYAVITAAVDEIIQESRQIKTFVLRPERPFSFRTGQFIELTLPGAGEAPFTPSSSHYQQERLEVTIMEAGFVTKRLHQVAKGVQLGLRGPYGSPYPLEAFRGREVVIVGGGVGLAPLRSLLLTMLHDSEDYRHISVCFGARTPEDFIYKTSLAQWAAHEKVSLHRSVDRVPDGSAWHEKVCLVTGLLDEVTVEPKTAIAVVCGPPVMMKFATLALLERGYQEDNIYLSMEKKMYCGIGQCRHCMIGKHYVCKDGPVFTYARIKDEENIWA